MGGQQMALLLGVYIVVRPHVQASLSHCSILFHNELEANNLRQFTRIQINQRYFLSQRWPR